MSSPRGAPDPAESRGERPTRPPHSLTPPLARSGRCTAKVARAGIERRRGRIGWVPTSPPWCGAHHPVPPGPAHTRPGRKVQGGSDSEGMDEDEWMDALQGQAYGHLAQRLAPTSRKKLKTVFNHLDRFQRRLPSRKLFIEPRRSGDMKALLHNEWSLIMFAEFLFRRKDKRTKRPLKTDTISEYVSMAKAELSVRYGFAIAGDPQRLPAIVKALRRLRPASARRERRGIRRRHLRAAWKAKDEFRAQSKDAVNLWAAATTAWQGIARAYEVAEGDGEDSRRDRRNNPNGERRLPTRADLSFGRKGGTRYACVMLRPCKRKNGEWGSKVPILFAEGDGMGSDTFAALWRMAHVDPCKPGTEHTTPLFRVGGKCLTVRRLRKLAVDIFKAAGQKGRTGAHAFRIGGATDLADEGASQALLQAKGRWASDIGRIYARMTRRAQLAASKAMQRSGGGGRDMEELFPGFTQAAL